MKLIKIIVLAGLFAVVGYRTGGMGRPAVPAAMAGSGPANCVGMCVQIYRMCMKSGDDPAACAAEREECKKECNKGLCEPGKPGCCGSMGQPDCPP